jgi:Holliday junction resolvase RusA-like endonuclease
MSAAQYRKYLAEQKPRSIQHKMGWPTSAEFKEAVRLPDRTLKLPFTLRLPMPPRELWPNSRANRFVRQRVKAAYKKECHFVALIAGGGGVPIKDKLIVDLRFVFTRSHRRADNDNLVASMKAALDALNELIWEDDAQVAIGAVEQVIGDLPGREWVELEIRWV